MLSAFVHEVQWELLSAAAWPCDGSRRLPNIDLCAFYLEEVEYLRRTSPERRAESHFSVRQVV